MVVLFNDTLYYYKANTLMHDKNKEIRTKNWHERVFDLRVRAFTLPFSFWHCLIISDLRWFLLFVDLVILKPTLYISTELLFREKAYFVIAFLGDFSSLRFLRFSALPFRYRLPSPPFVYFLGSS